MYKYLLCWRYLRTRYIALASIVSVMLGVATMIVVNSVMAGFGEKMRDRLHGVLADVVVESYDLEGFYDYPDVMARIEQVAGDKITAMSPTMETFGIMKIVLPNGKGFTRTVQVMGVRAEERAKTGDFAEFLVNDHGRQIPPSFQVSDELRRHSPAGELLKDLGSDDPFAKYYEERSREEVPEHGALIGYALGTVRRPGAKSDDFIAPPGSKILLAMMAGGRKPEPAYDDYTVVGYFQSGMSEYDSSHVYIPLERMQYLRKLGDGKGIGAVNQIQIKVKSGVDLDQLARTLQRSLEQMRPIFFRVSTWEQKQGPLLAAVAVEQSILNILLFFIIAVAGFGILGIFFMIVVEKTRDIGVLKALGASNSGVRGIFLGYGFALGLVGGGVGLGIGLLFVRYINTIEKWLSQLTGRKVFDDQIYYFSEIPTLVEASTVIGVVGGALLIAMAASVWPAQRAARLHPVQALRNE
jgi:lipoprotein-releasing system permease protein